MNKVLLSVQVMLSKHQTSPYLWAKASCQRHTEFMIVRDTLVCKYSVSS